MVATGTAVVLAVLVVGLAFANSVGAAQVARNAEELHHANASLGTAALTRAARQKQIPWAGGATGTRSDAEKPRAPPINRTGPMSRATTSSPSALSAAPFHPP